MLRREFLAGSLASAALALRTGRAAEPATTASDRVAFFFVSDTHYLSQPDGSAMLPESTAITTRLVETLNKLPGTPIDEKAGGGTVQAPLGVLHGGDVIDSGNAFDPQHEKMQEVEWRAFEADFGLTGKEGKLKYPVYEIHGNHDAPQGKGLASDAMRARTKKRPGVKETSKNGLQYSWDWGSFHFVHLGISVGHSGDTPRMRRYDPCDSIDFLVDDLKAHAKDRRPVILSHHVDVASYTKAIEPSAPFTNQAWDPADVQDYYKAIADYNIVAVFYGHTHGRKLHSWDGKSLAAKEGVSLFNCDNSGTTKEKPQAFYYVELSERELVVREYQTKDSWATAGWTGEVWKRTIKG